MSTVQEQQKMMLSVQDIQRRVLNSNLEELVRKLVEGWYEESMPIAII
jgi:hypothetical protein